MLKTVIAMLSTTAFVMLWVIPWLGLALALVSILLMSNARRIQLAYWRMQVLRTQEIADDYAATKGKWSLGVQRMYDKDVDYALTRYRSL